MFLHLQSVIQYPLEKVLGDFTYYLIVTYLSYEKQQSIDVSDDLMFTVPGSSSVHTDCLATLSILGTINHNLYLCL